MSKEMKSFIILSCALVACFLTVVLLMFSYEKKIPRPIDTDVAHLCQAYGGVKEMGWSSVTEMEHKTQTTKSVYCNDGSSVSRNVEVRK